MHQIQNFLGFCHGLHWESLQNCPRPAAAGEGARCPLIKNCPTLGSLGFALSIPTFYSMAPSMHEIFLKKSRVKKNHFIHQRLTIYQSFMTAKQPLLSTELYFCMQLCAGVNSIYSVGKKYTAISRRNFRH